MCYYSTGDVLSSCPDNINTDPNIVEIMGKTQRIDYCLFGCHLGIASDVMLSLIGDGDHSSTMIKIFERWNRAIVDPSEKTWGCILAALRRVGFETLANDIEVKL